MSLIPYAGKDSTEGKRVWNQPARALQMFRNGKDTLDIAKHFGIRESTALEWISQERSAIRGLSDPYA